MSDTIGDSAHLTAELQTLIESGIQKQRNEIDQLVSLWEELKKCPKKRLEASSIDVRAQDSRNESKISIISESPEDLLMWKLCLTTAIIKLNIDATRMECKLNKVSIIVKQGNVAKVLKYVHPLIERTFFRKVHFTPAIVASLPTRFAGTAELHRMIGFVIEKKKEGIDCVTRKWEQLRNNTCSRPVAFFTISRPIFEKTGSELAIACQTQEDYAIWKSCIAVKLVNLKITYVTHMTSIDGTKHEHVWMKSKDMRRLLGRLTPLAHITAFHNVTISDAKSTIIQSCEDLFKAGTVHKLKFAVANDDDDSYSVWLEFVRAVRPSIVAYFRKGLANENKFVLELAEMVEALTISEFFISRVNSKPTSISLFQEILRRKCTYLAVMGNNPTLSPAEAERLVKFFQHVDKKVAFSMKTRLPLMQHQIGEYRIIVADLAIRNEMIIEHQDIYPSLIDKLLM